MEEKINYEKVFEMIKNQVIKELERKIKEEDEKLKEELGDLIIVTREGGN